ncbi:FtsQ-type POTRA domain-containing protein [Agromyces aerolatus]|uniref:FtsQ-type POTRA domain-containing protein n=1 Tax=Agromyces sp. LY-1074 TaxID=3074080 RepID=UPI0028619FA6|nr:MULTISPECIES: FtsQ-type POTRA domain-containing protein [unclassified Agromyces]MDR5700766.1 cell division protein FtsQ/DivIB [Agromyces sp. LY-1074]MDR5707287.1 cell division protein FtsQ/DivIB [Agromyces sp. LY-1358]
MRRPQGFDGPPRQREPGRAAVASPADETRPVPPPGRSAPVEADATQPIEPFGRVGARSADATQPIEPLRGGAGADPDATQPIEPLRGPAEPRARSAGADVRAAKRDLARARAARKRYERQEVRRFTERSRRRRRAWLIGGGSVLLVSVGMVAIAYSPLMALREVRIEGAQRIQVAEIQGAFAEDLGTPLPLITSGDVQDALGGFPLIETYSTETLPPGTLVVRIVERTPVGVLETADGLELVDAAGVVIERMTERPEGQPVISAGSVTSEGFRAAAAVIRSLPPEVRAQVVQATAATADDVRLVLAGDATVVWGSAEQSPLKATVLAQLMRSAPPETVVTYDVSAPMSPGLVG